MWGSRHLGQCISTWFDVSGQHDSTAVFALGKDFPLLFGYKDGGHKKQSGRRGERKYISSNRIRTHRPLAPSQSPYGLSCPLSLCRRIYFSKTKNVSWRAGIGDCTPDGTFNRQDLRILVISERKERELEEHCLRCQGLHHIAVS
jgi:hypothetical protein